MNISSAAIIIPAFEPDERLPELVRHLRKKMENPIIVVNDGSGEDHDRFFAESGSVSDTVVLKHTANRGKGAALKTAFSYCLEHNFTGAVTADSDGQHLPEDILRCMEELSAHPDSLILGVREISRKDVPFKSRFGNVLTAFLFRILAGQPVSDTQTGLRGISCSLMPELLTLSGSGFEFEMQMLFAAKKEEFSFREVRISTVYEAGNKGTHFKPLRDSWKIYQSLFRESILQFLLFSCSGILSFFLDIGLFSLFFYWIFYAIPSGRLLISVVLARIFSAFFNYSLNRNVVFRHRKESYHDIPSLSKFVLLCLFITLASYFLTRWSIYLIPSWNVTLLKSLVDLILFYLSFSVQKFMIFRHSAR